MTNVNTGLKYKLKDSIRGLSLDFLLYRTQWKLAEKRLILTEHPLHLDIELTNFCNLKCDMCFTKYMTYPQGFMDFDLFKKIIDNGVKKGLKAIKLQSRGEPLLYPKFFEAIEYAKKRGVLDVHITTNATLLTKEKAKKVLNSGLDLLIFSIDASHKESYETLTKSSYDKVIDNIKYFLKLKEKINSKKPMTRFQMVQIPGKDNSLIDMVIKKLEKYADIISIINYTEFWDENGEDRNLGEKFNLLPCNYLWQRMVIFWNGETSFCCRDYNCTISLGNVKEKAMDEIWRSPKFNRYRQLHKKGLRNQIRVCSNCDIYTSKKEK